MLPGFQDSRALSMICFKFEQNSLTKAIRIKSKSNILRPLAAVFSCVNFKPFACRWIPYLSCTRNHRYLFDSPSSLSALPTPAKSTLSVPAYRRSPNTQPSPSPTPSASSDLPCFQPLPPVPVTYRRLRCHDGQWSQKHSCGSDLRREE